MSAKRSQGGYALVTALIFFLAATTAVLAGLSDSVLREVRVIRDESVSRQSYFASESALEDALYRMSVGKQVELAGVLAVASSTASYTVTYMQDGTKQVYSRAVFDGAERNTLAVVDSGINASFEYAIQTGSGGIDLSSSQIIGSAYTTGSIRSLGFSGISGDAIAAGTSYSSVDRVNDQPIPASNSLTFGNSNVTQDAAQSFTVTRSLSVTGLQVFVKRTGSPANVTVRIVEDEGGKPGGATLTSGTLSSSLVGVTYSWVDIALSSNPVLVTGDTYWIVFDNNTNSSAYYLLAANTAFAEGQARIGRYDADTWYETSPSGLDIYFKLSTGANQSGITGESEAVQLGTGSAYAYHVGNTAASGAIYCQIGSGNNKACDTSRPDPEARDYPVSATMIANWKEEAKAGGVSDGSMQIGHSGDTLGPLKVQGNLTVDGGGTLTVSGTLWVTGALTVAGNSVVAPAPGQNSFVIVADGGVTLSGGASVAGSSGNHVMIVSTAPTDPAISVSGGANDTALFAPYGGIFLSGGASAKAAASLHLSLSDGATVTYDPEMSRLNFSRGGGAGPSIKSWKEVE